MKMKNILFLVACAFVSQSAFGVQFTFFNQSNSTLSVSITGNDNKKIGTAVLVHPNQKYSFNILHRIFSVRWSDINNPLRLYIYSSGLPLLSGVQIGYGLGVLPELNVYVSD